MVECELRTIIIHENADQQFIYLREKQGARQFPIVIAITEALAIDRFVKEQRVIRPQTHELLHAVVGALEATVARVEVTELRNGTFFANLVLLRDGVEIDIDARPSDCIALAVRSGAPIYVSEAVLAEVAVGRRTRSKVATSSTCGVRGKRSKARRSVRS